MRGVGEGVFRSVGRDLRCGARWGMPLSSAPRTPVRGRPSVPLSRFKFRSPKHARTLHMHPTHAQMRAYSGPSPMRLRTLARTRADMHARTRLNADMLTLFQLISVQSLVLRDVLSKLAMS